MHRNAYVDSCIYVEYLLKHLATARGEDRRLYNFYIITHHLGNFEIEVRAVGYIFFIF